MQAELPHWIALTATEQLPIIAEPVLAASEGVAAVRTIALPYKTLSQTEEFYWGQQLAGAKGILLRSGFITRSLLAHMPNLKVVAVHGAGVDPVDVSACTERQIVVTNTPGANADAVSELTIGLMLCLIRKIPEASQKVTTHQAWDEARHLGGELRNRTLGLLGFGQVGRRVAKICKNFGMHVLVYDPIISKTDITRTGSESVNLNRLLLTSDIISIHAPSIPETKNIINERTLTLMKTGSLLINCARGSLVDEHALTRALKNGHLGGAALDVLDREPPNPNSPIFSAPNLIITPHMAGSTQECLQTIATIAGQDIVRVLTGKKALYPVNNFD